MNFRLYEGVQAYQGDSGHEIVLENLQLIQIQTIWRKAQVRFVSVALFTTRRSPKAVPYIEFDCLFVYRKVAQFLSLFYSSWKGVIRRWKLLVNKDFTFKIRSIMPRNAVPNFIFHLLYPSKQNNLLYDVFIK